MDASLWLTGDTCRGEATQFTSLAWPGYCLTASMDRMDVDCMDDGVLRINWDTLWFHSVLLKQFSLNPFFKTFIPG